MTEPGSGAHASGSQSTPDAGWAPPQQEAPAAPAEKKGLKKWLPVAGSVAVAGVIGASALGFGFGDPEVGDCVQMKGETDFEVVDCGTPEAEYKIVGIEEKEQTYPDFEADPTTCAAYENWEVALWIGGLETEPGTAYCAESV